MQLLVKTPKNTAIFETSFRMSPWSCMTLPWSGSLIRTPLVLKVLRFPGPKASARRQLQNERSPKCWPSCFFSARRIFSKSTCRTLPQSPASWRFEKHPSSGASKSHATGSCAEVTVVFTRNIHKRREKSLKCNQRAGFWKADLERPAESQRRSWSHR